MVAIVELLVVVLVVMCWVGGVCPCGAGWAPERCQYISLDLWECQRGGLRWLHLVVAAAKKPVSIISVAQQHEQSIQFFLC